MFGVDRCFCASWYLVSFCTTQKGQNFIPYVFNEPRSGRHSSMPHASNCHVSERANDATTPSSQLHFHLRSPTHLLMPSRRTCPHFYPRPAHLLTLIGIRNTPPYILRSPTRTNVESLFLQNNTGHRRRFPYFPFKDGGNLQYR